MRECSTIRFRFRSILVVLVLAGVAGSIATAVVTPTSPCPNPTPYPPPGAPWGVVNNPSFEGGFTGGAANQWVAWKDTAYSGTVHFLGTEHVLNGTYSQKLELPQPPQNDREAGLYQQVYAVQGGSYTVTARFWLEFAGETYTGEDLVAWLGVDPYGQASGDGPGMVWTQNVAEKSTWVTRSLTITAKLPVITISLKGTRKFPQHGCCGRVWFDHVTISGPIPSTPPPGPEPDPVDPETLIPAASGANLVANPSFEQAFTNGVSAGWNKWSTAGADPYRLWKPSLRIGKVGGGEYDCGGEPELVQMNPKTILLYGGDPETGGNGTYGTISYLNQHANLDDTIIVGRPAIDDHAGQYLTDPVNYGRHLADRLYLDQQEFPRIDCWQGLNEPGWNDEIFPQVLAFEKAFAERLHELGMKSCSLNLSTGSPGNIWKMIDAGEPGYPGCPDLLAVADYLGHHCYGGPSDDLMVTNQVNDDACSFAMRPRRFKDMYDRRGFRFPPVIATEGSTWGAWRGHWSPDTVGTDLMTMGDFMQANRWWCGYTNFVVGAACSWLGFDIVGQGTIVPDVGQWNADHPADAMDGLYSQVFGSGATHPKIAPDLTPRGQFTGGINQQINGLVPGKTYLFICWMKYEFRGAQPTLSFHLGVDPSGQTVNANSGGIDWGADQVPLHAPIHEIFSHVWRTFTASSSTASIWLRASQASANPSFRVFVDQVEVRQLDGTPSSLIVVDPLVLNPVAPYGSSPPDQTFTVRNGGAGTLEYTITDNATWLGVSPTIGTSTGETDTFVVHYSTASLAPGPYDAAITVTDPAASNSPQYVTVTLTIQPPPPVDADFDGDGDVDVNDFTFFQVCFNGPGGPFPFPECAAADLDGDGDVDVGDFTVFQVCFNGPNNVPASTCP